MPTNVVSSNIINKRHSSVWKFVLAASRYRIVGNMAELSEELKHVVQEIAKNKKISDFEIKTKEEKFSGDNYLGEICRMSVKGVGPDGREKNIYLIKKSPPSGSLTRKTMPIHEFFSREIFAYSEILPTLYNLQQDIPVDERFHQAEYLCGKAEEFNEMIIMKDLSYEGYKMYEKRISMDSTHMDFIIKYLARFHATSFVLKEKYPKTFENFVDSIPHACNYGNTMMELMDKTIKGIVHAIKCPDSREKFQAFSDVCVETVNKILDANETAPYNIICHGDCWCNNMLFQYTDGELSDVVFVDWQIIRYASPVTDIVYAFGMSTDQNFRKGHMLRLLDLYYETLKRNVSNMGCDLSKLYPYHIFQDHIKQTIEFGLSFGAFAIPFLLKENGEHKNLEDIVQDKDDDEKSKLLISDIISERLNEIVEDFLVHKFI